MKLKELCKISHGFAFKGKDIIKNHATKYVLVTPGNFNIGGGFKKNKCKYFSESGDIPKDYILKENDLIVTMTDLSVKSDTLGYSALIPKDDNNIYLHNQRIGLVHDIDESKVLKNYLYWFMRTKKYQQEVVASQSGTAIHHTSPDRILNIEIDLPSIDNQRKIVKILFDIENKIKNNNEINNNLYDISKQLLLKYLAENNNSEEINISELLDVFTGKKNANETTPTGKYKFFSCAPESLLSDTYLYDGAAIIVAGNGAYTGRTRFYDGKFELYQRTYGLTLKEGLNKNNIYGLYVFMKAIFEPDKMGGTHGSAIPYIVLSDLTNYRLKYNKEDFNKFSNLVSYNIKIIQENEKSNEQLEQLRDTLLSKLMNGEIDLDNIEI